jgi:hypothetical protein
LLASRAVTDRAVCQLISAIEKLCSEPPDFMQLVEVVGAQLGNLSQRADNELWAFFGLFLIALIQLIDADFALWNCPNFQAAFFQLSIDASPQLTRFYENLSRSPTPGLVYASQCNGKGRGASKAHGGGASSRNHAIDARGLADPRDVPHHGI